MKTSMMTILTSLFLGLGASLGPVNATTLEDAAASIHRLHLGPAKVWGVDADQFNCSAVAISEKQLVTAAHCIPTNPSQRTLSIVLEEKTRTELLSKTIYPVKVLRVNYGEDTALLELKTRTYEFDKFVDVAEHFTPYLGHKLYALGFPRGDVLTLTEGMYTATVGLEQSMRWTGDFYKTTIPITGGSSGGGLFVEKDGDYQLIGLASAGYRDVSFQNYFSSIESLHKIMTGFLGVPAPVDSLLGEQK